MKCENLFMVSEKNVKTGVFMALREIGKNKHLGVYFHYGLKFESHNQESPRNLNFN